MSEPHAIGRFFLRIILLLVLLLAVSISAPVLLKFKNYPIEVPLGIVFFIVWGALIMFVEKLIFGIPYPNFFR